MLGGIEIVELLLADPRVDPAAEDSRALLVASEEETRRPLGQREWLLAIVRLLLADPRVDPATDEKNALSCACQNDHFEVVELLLADPRVESASRYGDSKVVKLPSLKL
ncbi:hypothetical protein HDU87_005179 [Geranomyces variabilis]|uniref:Ankyrin repeat protein n=1 Tax=Geranomyces variabilis TaxID=109894 RepID=A0AAD5XRE1_9FUNG|nr:hypothetical protein HDU87_005179 [Geranomyces variabilis]